MIEPKINITNGDCLEAMRKMPDKCFDLAIVDPPYGIGASDKKFMNGRGRQNKEYFRENCWDIVPNKDYFEELFRISKNQIIWGGKLFHREPKKYKMFYILG